MDPRGYAVVNRKRLDVIWVSRPRWPRLFVSLLSVPYPVYGTFNTSPTMPKPMVSWECYTCPVLTESDATPFPSTRQIPFIIKIFKKQDHEGKRPVIMLLSFDPSHHYDWSNAIFNQSINNIISHWLNLDLFSHHQLITSFSVEMINAHVTNVGVETSITYLSVMTTPEFYCISQWKNKNWWIENKKTVLWDHMHMMYDILFQLRYIIN